MQSEIVDISSKVLDRFDHYGLDGLIVVSVILLVGFMFWRLTKTDDTQKRTLLEIMGQAFGQRISPIEKMVADNNKIVVDNSVKVALIQQSIEQMMQRIDQMPLDARRRQQDVEGCLNTACKRLYQIDPNLFPYEDFYHWKKISGRK